MKRRSFLKGVCAIPIVGLTPSIVSSDTTIPTESGLDRVIDIIQNDNRLKNRVTQEDIEEAINSANRMNNIILEAIINRGLANDRKISIADTREINDYIYHNHHDEWVLLHGNDEDNSRVGFHRVVNNGCKTKIFGKNAINSIFHNIYHLGFEIDGGNRLFDEDGNESASYRNVAEWLNTLLKKDLASNRLINPAIKEIVGETDTNLDDVIDIIYSDEGLNRKISTGDMRIGANSANEMNKLIIEAIDVTQVGGTTGLFTIDDIKAINRYLVENYSSRWRELHGYDKDNSEKGFHKVQKDGARVELFGVNAINRVFDGIYHLGFKTPYKNILVNEDGKENIPFKKVAEWLSKLLGDKLDNQKEDLEILIPLYIYPKDGAWKKLIDIKNSNPNISITAIINPNNGHFREEDSNYTKAIKELKSANIRVIGYVATTYGDRDIDEVIADIDSWSRIYKSVGVSGIFFDETTIYIDYFDYYKKLTSEARSRDLNFTILNAGITTDQKYIDSNIANIIVTYEHTARKLLENPPKTYNNPTNDTKLALLVYRLEDNIIDDLITFAREHKFSYIYFTEDGFDGNPWNSISEYLEAEADKALS